MSNKRYVNKLDQYICVAIQEAHFNKKLTFWHVIVEDNVDTLNIHTTAKQVRGDQNTALEVLEELVALETLLLVHGAVNINGRKVLLLQQGRQGNATLNRFDKNDDLFYQLLENQMKMGRNRNTAGFRRYLNF